MKLKLTIDRHTTESELIHLAHLFNGLGLNRSAHVVSETPIVEAGDDPTPAETVVVQVPNDAHSSGAGFDAPKRKRRTKAEIEAAAKAEVEKIIDAGEHLPPTEPEQVPATETPAPTQPATVTDTAPAQAPAEPEPASASPSEGGKTYTHAEVQALAVDTARRYGPEKVKALIATYPNAAKIAELDEGDLAGFVAKLQAITA